MKTRLLVGLSVVVLLATGCRDRDAEARKAREDVDAKARAEASRKEMEALPKAFKSPQFFKLNDPAEQPVPISEEKKP